MLHCPSPDPPDRLLDISRLYQLQRCLVQSLGFYRLVRIYLHQITEGSLGLVSQGHPGAVEETRLRSVGHNGGTLGCEMIIFQMLGIVIAGNTTVSYGSIGCCYVLVEHAYQLLRMPPLCCQPAFFRALRRLFVCFPRCVQPVHYRWCHFRLGRRLLRLRRGHLLRWKRCTWDISDATFVFWNV